MAQVGPVRRAISVSRLIVVDALLVLASIPRKVSRLCRLHNHHGRGDWRLCRPALLASGGGGLAPVVRPRAAREALESNRFGH